MSDQNMTDEHKSDPTKPPRPLEPAPRPGEPARTPAGEGPERVAPPHVEPDPGLPSGVPEAPPGEQRENGQREDGGQRENGKRD
jgi:hypothetical protein